MDEKEFKNAASAYFNAQSLYKLINAPSAFNVVADEKIIRQKNIGANGHHIEHFRLDGDQETTYAEPEVIDNNGESETYFSEYSEVGTNPERTAVIEDHEVIEQEAAPAWDHEEINAQQFT